MDVFHEFSEKVQTILACPDPQVILNALKALAAGGPANLQDETEIEELSGLGNQAQRRNPPEIYIQTITALLRWALKTFPNQSRWANHPNLWWLMELLDGPQGYNQRLIGDGLYMEGCHFTVSDFDGWGYIRTVPVPTVLFPPSQRQPVQPLDEDLSYISDFLRGNSTARTVLATRCKFGWPRLSVDCLCLFVDADDTTSLENSITSLTELVIINHTKLNHPVDNLQEAYEILAPNSISSLHATHRWYPFPKNYVQRHVQKHGHIYHGQSISLIGDESKGSVGVFLSPCGNEKPQTYALTAYHPVPFKEAGEKRVMTPGGLDLLAQLEAADKREPEDTETLLKQGKEACGYAEFGHIGATKEGWRSDFALIRLDDHWVGENGQWYNDDLRVVYRDTENSHFPGERGIVGSVEPQAGDIVYMEGASTGCAPAMIGSCEVVLFEKRGTANMANGDTAPEVVRAKFLLAEPIGQDKDLCLCGCAPGDLGCGVFKPAPEEDGWKWAGQLVSKMLVNGKRPLHPGQPKEYNWVGLVIPPSKVFQALKENTGMEWRMSG